MSHDLFASWACSEIAHILREEQSSYFANTGEVAGWAVGAGREGGRLWPLADGVISTSHVSDIDINIAVEFKRVNEGLHGTLTAIGQSLAYLHKGYHGAFIVIPEKYDSYASPGEHISEILNLTASTLPIGVFVYKEPNVNSIRPFDGKIECIKAPNLTANLLSQSTTHSRARASTLWAHVREGSSYPDSLYKFCKEVKYTTSRDTDEDFYIHPEAINAIRRLNSNVDPSKYLSKTASDNILDRTWRNIWFKYYFHESYQPIFTKDAQGKYIINEETTKIFKDKTSYQTLYTERSDSYKNVLVDQLNNRSISEDIAWEKYVKKIRDRSHSTRQDIDSGLDHLNLIDADGKLTKVGYAFVDAADKGNSVYSADSMQILRGTSLKYGNFLTFLHYIFNLSNEKFSENNLAFTTETANGITFKSVEYKAYLHDKMLNELSLMLTSSVRNPGNPRTAFQAEIPYLKYLGLIEDESTFRVGLGFNINWPLVQESMEYMNNNNL